MKHAPVKTKMIAYQHDDNFHQFPFTSTKLTPKGASLLVYWPKSWLIFSRVNSFPLILGDLARFFSIQLPWTSTAPSKRRSWKLVGETMKWYPPWNRHLPETWESKGTPPMPPSARKYDLVLGIIPLNTNIFLENGWLEDDHFLLHWAFCQRLLLSCLVSGWVSFFINFP